MCRISKIITFLESLRQAGWFDLFENDIQELLIFDPLITLWGNFDAPYLKLLNDASVASACFYVRTCRRVKNSKKIATIRDFHLPGSFLCLSTRLLMYLWSVCFRAFLQGSTLLIFYFTKESLQRESFSLLNLSIYSKIFFRHLQSDDQFPFPSGPAVKHLLIELQVILDEPLLVTLLPLALAVPPKQFHAAMHLVDSNGDPMKVFLFHAGVGRTSIMSRLCLGTMHGVNFYYRWVGWRRCWWKLWVSWWCPSSRSKPKAAKRSARNRPQSFSCSLPLMIVPHK